jgi:psiF repeat.
MRLSMQLALAAFAALAFAAPANANDAPAPVATHKTDCASDKDAKADAKHDCDTRTAEREPQTHKMVRCNEEAGKKQLHGDERRAFMSACLKN